LGPITNQLWLIRHGETEWSRSGQHTSRTDLPLTEEGERRAGLLAAYLKDRAFALVLASPMQRAQCTCAIAGLTPQTDADLCEWDYGDYEGKTTAQIRQQDPDWTIWTGVCPNGEAAVRVAARADRVIARCSLVGDAALFSHGHFLRVLAARWLGLAPEAGRYFALDTGTVSILGYEHETRVIRQWNRILS